MAQAGGRRFVLPQAARPFGLAAAAARTGGGRVASFVVVVQVGVRRFVQPRRGFPARSELGGEGML